MKKVILVGYAATGKTTVGKALAERLGCAFYDTDQVTEQRMGESVADMIRTHGEQYFRREEAVTLSLLAPERDCVIACGGGSVLLTEFRSFAAGSVGIWLQASPQTVLSRLDGSSRPLAEGKSVEQLAEDMERRAMKYVAFSSMIFVTDGKSPAEVAEEIAVWKPIFN